MSKASKKTIFGGGEGGSSSKASKPPRVSEADEELARKLNEELNAGLVENEKPDDHDHGRIDYPVEIQTAVDYIHRFANDVLSTTCHKCEARLIQDLDVSYWVQTWEASRDLYTAPPTSAIKCECGVRTCLGCAEKPLRGNPKFMAEYEGVKLDWCCNKGAVFVAWVLLCQYDNMELSLQARSSQNQIISKYAAGYGGPSKGTGYGACQNHFNPLDFRRAGLQQALNFRQVDEETDNITNWIFGMLIKLLPKWNEASKKISPSLPSMIELSLLQDRTAELLRNDSLRDVDKRNALYWAAFEFVGRLGNHPQLDYLVREERFLKKQSAGLYAIATAGSGKGKSKGKGKAQRPLAMASKSEGKASSLISCLSKLATQSKVLLEGFNRETAGGNIWEIAGKVDKLYTRLADKTANVIAITTWKEYHQAHCLTRRADVARHLCYDMAQIAREVTNSAKGRMGRLVTETSEMTTSLAENVFVTVDEVRPDIMKVLYHSALSISSSRCL